MRTTLLILTLAIMVQLCHAQVYIEKRTRHRFAQLNMGLDVQASFGGNTSYIGPQGYTQSLDLASSVSPRFLIGGTHFWGHADFYIGIPLYVPTLEDDNQEITAYRGVETVFKFYPLRIERHKLRPYIGVSLAPVHFEQRNNNLVYPDGPELSRTNFPLLGGLTYNTGNHLLELGIAWDYNNRHDYYISRTQSATIQTPPVYATLSYRYMLETTLSAERDWESGRTQEVTRILAERGKLDGFYLGAGVSAAFWQGKSSYNTQERPYLQPYGITTMPDFTLGYYLHRPDMNFALAYRGYRTTTEAYGAEQQLSRRSIVLEVTKSLFDYHGFVPFVGPAVSYEQLAFQEDFEGANIHDIRTRKAGYGLTFGWDIRPNRLQSWLLRTNLRWWPDLSLDVGDDRSIAFDNLEFNFIQLVIYPGRMF